MIVDFRPKEQERSLMAQSYYKEPGRKVCVLFENGTGTLLYLNIDPRDKNVLTKLEVE